MKPTEPNHPYAVDAALLILQASRLAATGVAFVLVERIMRKAARYAWLAIEEELNRGGR